MVVVTAVLPQHLGDGTRVAASVTAIGDAVSLAGRTLLPTPLRNPNGVVYAVSRGQIQVGARIDTVAGEARLSDVDSRSGIVADGAIADSGRLQELAVE